MAKTIIEIIHPHHHQKEIKTFDSAVITIGRSYKNDLIILDPYISAEHAIVRANEFGWEIEDIGAENGIFVNKHTKNTRKALLSSGDEVMIGRTLLRIISASHPVEPAKKLTPTTNFFRFISNPKNAWGLLCAVFFSYLLTAHLEAHKKSSLAELSLAGIFTVTAIFLGAGAWSFIGHLIKNKSRFIAQLAMFSIFFLLLLAQKNISGYIGYFTSNVAVESITSTIIFLLIFFFLLLMNLHIATNISLRKRIISSAVINLFLAVLIMVGYLAAKAHFSPKPTYCSDLKPPLVKIFPSKSAAQFIKNSGWVFSFKESERK